MKKGFLVALVVTLMMSVTNVSAMTKDELKTKLTKEYTINGATFKASASDVAQIERYLEQNNVSEADADKISAKVDEAVSIIEAGNATKLEELTTTEKDKLIGLLSDISNTTSVKVTVNKGVITVYNIDGTEFTKITDMIKQTGANYTIVIIAGVISILGFLVIANKMKKNA